MKKKLTLLIFLFPALVFAQVEYNKGTISFDLHGKDKHKDTIQQQQPQQTTYPSDEDEDQPAKTKKERKQARVNGGEKEEEVPDYRRDGLFKALFHVGIVGAQIDGDGFSGYNHIGADVGIGAMVRFHKYFSASMEINYSMQGAKQKLVQNSNGGTYDSSGLFRPSLFMYRVNWDYIEVPVALTVQDKKYVMFSLGLSPCVMVRYNERDQQGQDITNNPAGGQPKRFDLKAFGMLQFVIASHYALGLKFSYSLLSIRGTPAPGVSKVLGEYNNVLTFRFMYILDTVKKKK